MQLTILKAKLHQARVTRCELNYEGSCAIDGTLMDVAGIHQYEQIHIYNLANGGRLTTYAIRAEDDSGIISVNGAAARKALPGDRIIICAYISLDEQQLTHFKPKLVYLDDDNNIINKCHSTPMQ